MKIIETILDDFSVKKGCVLTVGNFDGIHLGHQQILKAAKKIALEKNTDLIVMTFEPHPVAVLHPEKAPGVLTPLNVKKKLIQEYGADCLVVIRDSSELLKLSPDDFVERFLIRKISPCVVTEGEDFNFGKNRQGSIKTLKKLGKEKGFEVAVVEPKYVTLTTGQKVRASSTIVRYMLGSGNVADAATVLARPYKLVGRIIAGRGKGKQLGFPTANMEIPNQIIPAEGVYAGFVRIADNAENVLQTNKKMPAVFSVGQLRTFGDEFPLAIEAHLLTEGVEDLIGQWMAMDFANHIRSQHKFKTENDLCAQIEKDCKEAKEILEK
ncbi:MAG: bifunctional riboflavin kinase/FAD synthetase [Planctomycetota bacterium]|jgi:riboflavin kinase/FMN adenylyltransferase